MHVLSKYGENRSISNEMAAFNVNDGGCTVNILALVVCKAFPRVNKRALISKLIKRNCPNNLI